MMMMLVPGWGDGGGTRQCAVEYAAYRNAKLLRHRQRGRPGPVAGFKARSSQVELPNARALYFSLSLTPTFRTHTRCNEILLGRDLDRLISNEHEYVADGPESVSDRELVRATLL